MRISDWSSDVCSSNLIQGETQITRAFDERQAIKVRAIIESIVATATDGSGNQPFCLVETDRLYLQPSALCDLTDFHRPTSLTSLRMRVHTGRLFHKSRLDNDRRSFPFKTKT